VKDLIGRLVWSDESGYGVIISKRLANSNQWQVGFQKGLQVQSQGYRGIPLSEYDPDTMTVLPNPGEVIRVWGNFGHGDKNDTEGYTEKYEAYFPGDDLPILANGGFYKRFALIDEPPFATAGIVPGYGKSNEMDLNELTDEVIMSRQWLANRFTNEWCPVWGKVDGLYVLKGKGSFLPVPKSWFVGKCSARYPEGLPRDSRLRNVKIIEDV